MQANNTLEAQATAAAAILEKHGMKLEHAALIELVNELRSTAPADAEAGSHYTNPEWSVAAGPMTDGQYLARGGNCCPSCGSGDISGSSITVDGREAYQQVTCSDCNAEWNDMYTLTGHSDLEGGINLENISTVVDDVKRRAEKYGFSVDSVAQAHECIADSSDELGEELSDPEIKIAVERLLMPE